MDTIKDFQNYFPKEHVKSFITFSSILSLNFLLLNSCIFFGCYEVNFTNLFRLNLFCNACTDMSYHLQKFQIQIYVALGGYSLKKVNDFIHQHTQSKILSKSSR